jgi:hypothetical protein
VTTLNPAQLDYLRGRGYADELVQKHGLIGIPSDREKVMGLDLVDQGGFVCWPTFSMAGTLMGLHTRSVVEKKYRWKQVPGTEHLPICYGQPEDYRLIWDTQECVLVEGIFDWLAMRLAFPERAVLARLSKGAGRQLATFLRRYVRQLWLAFDNDEPGKAGAEKAELSLGGAMAVEILSSPVHDPSKLLEKRGIKGVRSVFQPQFDTKGGW